MPEIVVRFDNCHKRWATRGRPALQGLSFSVTAGRVTALLGPNGSGKSTAFRAATGLVRLTDGAVELFGTSTRHELWRVARRIGVVPDNPTWFKRFDLTTTLELLARPQGVALDRVPVVLGQVGLADAAGQKTGALSLGMRRRLALAAAILHEPELLILDEPANGLDPEGHAQLRGFVRHFVAAGGTVLLSSHLLGDVERLADDVVVIAAGRVVEAGPLSQFVRAGTGFVVRVAGPARSALLVLRRAGIAARLAGDDRSGDLVVGADIAPEHISLALAAAGIGITHLSAVEVPLEARYLELVGDAEHPSWGR